MKDNYLQEKYLIFKAKNKDPDAYSKVYDLYVDRIYRFIYFKVSSQEDAQDLTSEVFLKTWQYIIDGKDIKNLNALFYKIARNIVIDHYRKAQRKDVALDEEIADQKEMSLAIDQVAKLDAKIKVEKVEAKLALLKDEFREVIILKYIEGLSIQEIAEIVAKKNGNVRVILYRAINALKELMEDEDQ
jgi:RNA polymerase sigma-70 factor, ECF subfamily